MKPKKEKIIKKIVKKDYNNELENIIAEKEFTENAKSILLAILYKIETSYKDVKTVKQNVETKEEYLQNLINIIQKKCDKFEVIRMSDNTGKIPENKTFVINKEKKEIIAYPIERKVLYAIAKIGKKDKIVKDDYYILDETISNMINVGNNINMVEPLRDFNGYSWTTMASEIESIDHNLIYQNLRILIGYKFLNRWVKSKEFIMDYYEVLKNNLEKKYGKNNENSIIEELEKLSILLEIKFDKSKEEEISDEFERVSNLLNKMENKKEMIQEITEQKTEITKELRRYDTTINNKELLKQEYILRNEELPIDKKIFSLKILKKMMLEEREKNFTKIDELNKMLNPQKFVKYKNKLQYQFEYLKMADIENCEEELQRHKIILQKSFLKCFKSLISSIENKQDIMNLIYEFRYYIMLPFDNKTIIMERDELKVDLEKITRLLIKKANKLKAMEVISDNEETDYEILKNIFEVRIINLSDVYLKVFKEKDNYYIQIFDENTFEQKMEIDRPVDLNIKLNKKISIFS